MTSISATERVRLWNKFAQPFDHETVKMDFFRRVHMKNPPFRVKVPIKLAESIEIPPMVKYHYENPPPLLPSLRDTLRYDIVKRRKCLPSAPEIISKESVAESLVKDLEALKSAKAKFREIQKELGNVEELSSSSSSESEDDTDKTEDIENKSTKEMTTKEAEDSKEKEKSLISKNMPKIKRIKQMPTQDSQIKTEEEPPVCDKDEKPLELSNTQEKLEHENSGDDLDEEIKYDPHIDAELQYLDVDLIKKLAYQRLQQLVQEHPEIVVQYQNRTAAKRIRELSDEFPSTVIQSDQQTNQAIIPSEVLSPTDVRRLCIMFTGETSSILAQPSSESDLHQLHPALATAAAIVAADEEEKKYVARSRTDQEKSYEIATRLELKMLRRKVRARAVLTPLGDILEDNRWFSNVELHNSFFMRYRSFNVGYGDFNAGVDVNLFLIGYCRRISPKHATIFYDDFTKTYELINYSEHGTEVNGQLYSCDFTEREPTPAKRLKNEDIELQKKVQAILDKRRGIQRHYYAVDNSTRFVLCINRCLTLKYNY